MIRNQPMPPRQTIRARALGRTLLGPLAIVAVAALSAVLFASCEDKQATMPTTSQQQPATQPSQAPANQQAQPAANPAQQPTPPPTDAAPAPEPDAEELAQFAKAQTAVREIREQMSTAEDPAEAEALQQRAAALLEAGVRGAGLTLDRYSQILEMLQNNPELLKRYMEIAADKAN